MDYQADLLLFTNEDSDASEDDRIADEICDEDDRSSASSSNVSESSEVSIDPHEALAGIPPWLDNQIPDGDRHPLVRLHDEIVDFARMASPNQKELELRDGLVAEIAAIVEEVFDGERKIEVFGSLATGLLLPSSDIDVVCVLKEEPSSSASADTDYAIKSASPMRTLADALLSSWGDSLTYLEVLEHTRVPLVKLTHGPTNLSVDVSFDMSTGPAAALLMRRFLTDLPPLRPLTLALKQFLACRNLNQPYHGGVGSFALQMMVVSFLQQRRREDVVAGRPPVANLGSMLLDFLELYGLNFNYVTTGISVELDGSYFPKCHDSLWPSFFQETRPFALAMENPLEPGMDVGKSSFRIQLVKKAFEVNFKVLLGAVTNPEDPPMSILATVLPPERWMEGRMTRESDGLLKRWVEEGSGWDHEKDKKMEGGKKKRKRATEFLVEVEVEDGEEGSGGEAGLAVAKALAAPRNPPPRSASSSPTPVQQPNKKAKANQPNVSFRVFSCNNATRNECLSRHLFGAPSDNTKTRRGDVLFLHNFESKTVEGPFQAACDSRWNIDPAVFKGRFRYQVQVRPLDDAAVDSADLAKNVVRMPLGKFHERLKSRTKKVPPTLDEQEGSGLLKLCKRLGWVARWEGLNI